jgi:hypothetical protein
VIKCVGDFEAAFKAKALSDKTLTVGEWSGANFAAALPALADYITGQPGWAKTYLPLIEGNPAQ